MDSIAQGLEFLQALPEAGPVKDQLGVLRKLAAHAAEALEAFSDVISATPAS